MNRKLTDLAVANRRIISLILHLVLGGVAFVLAFLVRFDFSGIPRGYLNLMMMALPLAIGIKGIALMYYGLTTGLWRYVGIDDLSRILKTVSVSTLAFLVAAILVFGHGFPRSIYVLDFLLTIILFGGVRFAIRMFRESFRPMIRGSSGKRTLIIGAGDAGEIALRSLMKDYMGVYQVVGFLDDDPLKQRMSIHGVPILGTIKRAPAIVKELDITEVLIAISAAGKQFIRDIVESCGGHNVSFRIMPAIESFMTGELAIEAIRKVKLEDLLGREPIRLDKSAVRAELSGKAVLVTGAGGSIGSELSRQIAAFGPATLVLLDVAETPLFEIHRELSERYPNLDLRPILADVRCRDQLREAFDAVHPVHVYHAAAYKHVPLMEKHPVHAVSNNIVGTKNLIEEASAHGTARFVMISTDKAVKPGSIMGATKRVCELVVAHANRDRTRFASVRFGNVLGSNGSVIPIFEKQIAAGGPVRVTHAEMTRYFMTIPEAVELVLQAGAISEGNDVFVLNMGTPVRIIDLARNMIKLSGMVPGEDILIEETGLRPGEKLHEELTSHGEQLIPTAVEKVNRLRHGNDRTHPGFNDDLDHLIHASQVGDATQTRELLWAMIEKDQGHARGEGQ